MTTRIIDEIITNEATEARTKNAFSLSYFSFYAEWFCKYPIPVEEAIDHWALWADLHHMVFSLNYICVSYRTNEAKVIKKGRIGFLCV